jgi:glycosyltransferase involved in cell wall biosynthesis
MRIAIVDTYYPAFVASFYERHPGLAEAPYERQLEALLMSSFGTSDAYSHHLRALGHEAIDLIADCTPLQHRWAVEHGAVRLGRLAAAAMPGIAGARAQRRALRQITLRQVAEFEPDVVFCHNLAFFSRAELDELRKRHFVVGQIASPLPPARLVGGFDLVLTSFPHFVPRIRALGPDSEFFRLGVDPRVVERVRAAGQDPTRLDARPYGVVFVGGVNPRVHAQGTRLLEELAARFPVDVWGYGAGELPPGSPILERYHSEAWGLDMYKALAGARIAVNRHIDAAEGHANNMRLYEATAMGALLVTDAGIGLDEIFEPGREVLSYTQADDLIGQIERALADEDERVAIAAAGQRRALEEHSFARRMAELVEMLEARPIARARRR